MKRSRLATYAMGIAVAAAMTGCGDDGGGFADESAKDIVAAAQKAMGDLESLHIQGEINSDDSNIVMDLSLSTTGSCEGTIELDGGGLEVLQAGDEGWFKADAAFWEAQAPDQAAEIIAATGDNWVVDSGGQYTSFCDLDGFLEEIVSTDDSEDDFKKDGTEDVDGEEAVKITGDDSTAFIATDEPHYILQLEGSGDDEGNVTFADFNDEVEVEAPADDEIVTLD